MSKKIKHINSRVYKKIKPFYKRWWFISLVAFIISGAIVYQGASKKQSIETSTSTENDINLTSKAQNESDEAVKSTSMTSSTLTSIETASVQSTTETSIALEETILTKENNQDLAHILNDSSDLESYKKFVEKYEGQKIEFDGNISNMQKYGNNNTRYNFLIYSGDYSETSTTGAGFHIQDKNVTYDLKLTGDNIPDTIGEGQNISIIAEIIAYADNDLIIIDPVETRIR